MQGCDKGAPTQPVKEIVLDVSSMDFPAGSSFRAHLKATSVIPRFSKKEVAKRIGKYRAIDAHTTIETTFYAELMGNHPEKWRIDFESFDRRTRNEGAEEATSTFELPNRAFTVEWTKPEPTVVDIEGNDVTDSQREVLIGIAHVLAERRGWSEWLEPREIERGNIIEAPGVLIPGHFVVAMLGPRSDAATTVEFFRLGADEGAGEVAHINVHGTFRTVEEAMTDGSYFDYKAEGRVVVRATDGLLVGYDLKSKVTPRAQSGAMLPEGSGSWHIKFAVDTATIQSKK